MSSHMWAGIFWIASTYLLRARIWNDYAHYVLAHNKLTMSSHMWAGIFLDCEHIFVTSSYLKRLRALCVSITSSQWARICELELFWIATTFLRLQAHICYEPIRARIWNDNEHIHTSFIRNKLTCASSHNQSHNIWIASSFLLRARYVRVRAKICELAKDCTC